MCIRDRAHIDAKVKTLIRSFFFLSSLTSESFNSLSIDIEELYKLKKISKNYLTAVPAIKLFNCSASSQEFGQRMLSFSKLAFANAGISNSTKSSP